MKKSIISIVLIIAAFLIGYGLGTQKQVQKTADVPQKNGTVAVETKEPIKIGAIFSLTGDLASYGLEFQRALDLEVEKINNQGGINGRKIEVIYEDGPCGNPNAGVTAAQKLVNVDKVKIILGPVCSGDTLAVVPITEVGKVILISPSATSPNITTVGNYVFRLCPSDALAGRRTAELAYNTFGYKKGAVIAENTDFSQMLKKVFTENFEKLGGTVVASESYNTGDTDMRTQILKVKNSEAEFVYLAPQTVTPGALLAKQAIESGLKLRLIGNEFYGELDLLKVAGEAAEGIVYYVPAAPKDNPETQKFYTDFKNKYGVEVAITQYTPNIYDILQIVAEGLRKYGEDTEQIKDYFYSIKDYQGVSGRFSFDTNGDVDKDYSLMVVKNGKAELYQE